VVDITNDSVVVCLTGVPHYITDATITMLVSTFGISIGEVERRFYKGVDTGERFVRLKPRARTQIPDFVTVGGCKILIRVLSQDEVVQPFTLQSSANAVDDGGNSGGAVSMHHQAISGGGGGTSSSTCSTMPIFGSSNNGGPKSRSKPGHCNGTVNSTSGGGSCAGSGSGSIVTTTAVLGGTGTGLFTNTFGTSNILTSSRADMISTGCTGLHSTPMCAPDNQSTESQDHPPPPQSPKIGRSLRSRLSTGSMLKSTSPMNPPDGLDEVDLETNSYLPGDSLDIPTLSPPPYKAPGSSSAGGSTSSILNGRGRDNIRDNGKAGSENGDAKSSSSRTRDSATNGLAAGACSTSSMMKKYAQSSMHRMPPKTDSSTSLTSSLAGKSTEALKDGFAGGNKRSSGVVFEEESAEDDEQEAANEKAHRQGRNKSSKSSILTSKTVNGILRKGSGPADELVPSSEKQREKIKLRKSKEHHKHKSKSASRGSTRLEAVSESGDRNGDENGDADKKEKPLLSKSASKHSRNNSTKSSGKDGKDGKDGSLNKDAKHQKDLALTRDLPWCGCWGNGCL
jgi:hypothetical protein